MKKGVFSLLNNKKKKKMKEREKKKGKYWSRDQLYFIPQQPLIIFVKHFHKNKVTFLVSMSRTVHLI
jgi:hypothetical protein